ncbi:hypothetical protein JCM33374_g3113 [Metschnikowia sp. JCM 33374]|nr:hypothetical protein JCM33374_g3113 [Metschnikowia sp. JCM 33374]
MTLSATLKPTPTPNQGEASSEIGLAAAGSQSLSQLLRNRHIFNPNGLKPYQITIQAMLWVKTLRAILEGETLIPEHLKIAYLYQNLGGMARLEARKEEFVSVDSVYEWVSNSYLYEDPQQIVFFVYDALCTLQQTGSLQEYNDAFADILFYHNNCDSKIPQIYINKQYIAGLNNSYLQDHLTSTYAFSKEASKIEDIMRDAKKWTARKRVHCAHLTNSSVSSNPRQKVFQQRDFNFQKPCYELVGNQFNILEGQG